ncbi:hypothetical protein BSP4_31750 [Bacillus subtilis subsp. subtilis]|nr:hypothetical protein BSP4_31750 [Bacillus subtilis subsp. subtilis]
MIQGFYKDQKLHLLEDPMQQYTVMKVEKMQYVFSDGSMTIDTKLRDLQMLKRLKSSLEKDGLNNKKGRYRNL